MNIVVSGASQGIGYETALLFSKNGHQVLAIARNNDKLRSLQEQNSLIKVLAIDLLDDSLRERVEGEIQEWGKVDILINNAGQLINKPFMETTKEDFSDQYHSNVISAVTLIKALNERMSEGAHIVNITSMGGVQGSSKFPGLSAYSASKGALSILSECLAEEFVEKGISVNALALGAVQTDMLKNAFPDYKAPLTAKEMAEYICDFSINGNKYYNGKVLQVALGNP